MTHGVPATERRAGTCGAAPLGAGKGARVLAADVGAGTADILLTLAGEPLENAVRLVVPSRTQVVAREIGAATKNGDTVVFTGPVMGGGASGAAMKRHVAAGLRFVAGESAALTFDDDLEVVRSRGIEVVADEMAAAMAADAARPGAGTVAVRSGDLDVDGLRDVLVRLGVDPSFDAVCIAVQDHGFSPHGSNRVVRFAFWEQAVAERRTLRDMFWEPLAIPEAFTRLCAAAALAAELGRGAPVLAADTGPAAIYGAMTEATGDGADGSAASASDGDSPIGGDGDPPTGGDAVLVNAGNGHTVCVVAREQRLAGVFEHHTSALDGPALEHYLRRFFAGELTSAEVREGGGHGAVLAADAHVAIGTRVLVTGPRRDLLRNVGLQLEFAAPHGDMMLTGCYGLLRAARERGLAGVPR